MTHPEWFLVRGSWYEGVWVGSMKTTFRVLNAVG